MVVFDNARELVAERMCAKQGEDQLDRSGKSTLAISPLRFMGHLVGRDTPWNLIQNYSVICAWRMERRTSYRMGICVAAARSSTDREDSGASEACGEPAVAGFNDGGLRS